MEISDFIRCTLCEKVSRYDGKSFNLKMFSAIIPVFGGLPLKYGEKKDNELQFVAHYLFVLLIGYHGTR